MGVVSGISDTHWPKQGAYLGLRCSVMFNYSRPEYQGVVVRDDAEAPGRLIIRLDDGRHVLSTECQWSPRPDPHTPISGGEG